MTLTQLQPGHVRQTIKFILQYAVEQSRKWNFVYRKGLSIALNGVSYHKTKKAKDWLFDGFEDPFLNSVKYLPFLDDIPDMDRFAWFYGVSDLVYKRFFW